MRWHDLQKGAYGAGFDTVDKCQCFGDGGGNSETCQTGARTMLLFECLCPLNTFLLKPNLGVVLLGGGAFGDRVGHEDGPHEWDECLYKRPWREPSPLPSFEETQ